MSDYTEIDNMDYIMHHVLRYMHYDYVFLLMLSICLTILMVYVSPLFVVGSLLLMLFFNIILYFVLYVMIAVVRLFTRRITILHNIFALVLFPMMYIAVTAIATFEAMIADNKHEKLPGMMSNLMIATMTKNSKDFMRDAINYDIGIKFPITEEYDYYAMITNKYHFISLILLYLFLAVMSVAMNTGIAVFVFVMMFAHMYRMYLYYKRHYLLKYSLFMFL